MMPLFCRLCASLKKVQLLFNIHEMLDIRTKLETCCQIIIPEKSQDQLPQNVCNECIGKLNDFWHFYHKVRESQDSLWQIFGKCDTKNQPTETKQSTNVTASHLAEQEVIRSIINVSIKKIDVQKFPSSTAQIDDNNEYNVHQKNDIHFQQNSINEHFKSKIAERLEFNDLHDDILDNLPNRLQTRMSSLENKIFDDIQLQNLNSSEPVRESDNASSNVTEIIENVDRETIYEVEQIFESSINNSENQEVTGNSSTSLNLSTSLTKSILLESLNESHLETLGAWNEYSWKCVYCTEFSTNNVIDLCQHIYEKHAGEIIKFFCLDCLRTSEQYYKFLNHVKIKHREQLMLCCDLCSEFFDTAQLLADHRFSIHSFESINENFAQLSLIYCPDCGKAFKNNSSLKTHSKNHEPMQKKISCNICSKMILKANLKTHYKIHSGIKDFICSICGKEFSQKSNHDKHILTHTENKPFECNECHKQFKTSERLTKHLVVHNNIKPYKCLECDKSFREKDTLRCHERIHTGERPYSCSFCGKSFRFRSIFKSHLNIHTGNRPHSCFDCNLHFTNWSNYSKHMQRRHANLSDTKSNSSRNNKKAKDNIGSASSSASSSNVSTSSTIV